MKGLWTLCSHLACDWSSRAAFVCGLSKARTRFLMSSHTSTHVDAAFRYIWPPRPFVPLSVGVHHHNGQDTHHSAFSVRFDGISHPNLKLFMQRFCIFVLLIRYESIFFCFHFLLLNYSSSLQLLSLSFSFQLVSFCFLFSFSLARAPVLAIHPQSLTTCQGKWDQCWIDITRWWEQLMFHFLITANESRKL